MNAFSTVVLHERHVANYAGRTASRSTAGDEEQKIDDAYYRTLDSRAADATGTSS